MLDFMAILPRQCDCCVHVCMYLCVCNMSVRICVGNERFIVGFSLFPFISLGCSVVMRHILYHNWLADTMMMLLLLHGSIVNHRRRWMREITTRQCMWKAVHLRR